MKLERHFDAKQINEVINHPSVYPWVRGLIDGPLDLSPALADRGNVLLMGKHGGILFDRHQSGLYEAHTSVLPEGRGAWCLEMVHAALHWMFTRTDCVEVTTRVPKGNLAARALTRAAGLSFRFNHPQGWAFQGQIIPADVFSLTIHDWIGKAPGLDVAGARAHRITRIGYADELNQRHLGSAFAMILGGQPKKGVVFFNRWAAMTDQPPLEMFTQKPLAFEYRDDLIVFRASGEYYVAGTDLQAAS